MPTQSRPLAVVTGASSGLGRGFATRFADRGYDLVLIARRRTRLEELAAELRAAYGVTALPLDYDLAQAGAPAAIAQHLADNDIRPDALVNCAGFGTAALFVTEAADRIEQEIAVDVTAPTLLARLLLPDLLRAPRGVLLMVSSTASHQPIPSIAVYAACKAYLTSLSAAIWQETRGSDLRVLALCPGPTETEFFSAAGSERFKVGRVAGVDEVLDAAFRAIDRGDAPVVTVGLRNRLQALVAKFAPLRVSLAVSERATRPKEAVPA
ncbi:putative oxidoreductase, SDR family [Nocardia nova SH22a]|uniref:Putative oxidoreductase, SDR family n=1 Tax=Nocardia nova SH22a TaxID=1415166 RepID=W5TH48_9NOCA|nr:SDR family NAD(P)-dependent oxidoreductase [Nocardia nova]AHH18479.1 putative oxidoreductase, SDR family [Nocardia nova SH22a]